jgi:sulfhydrogenase subunit gamma (sulfur reductase)
MTHHDHTAAPEAAQQSEVFVPFFGQILEIKEMTAREKFYKVELPRPLGHRPGQFVMVSVPGVGEAPISISCGPRQDNLLELVIRKAGSVTGVFHNLKVGQMLGVRGPFGSGFDITKFHGKDLLFVCGGLGLAPLRSLITPVVENRAKFGEVTILSGARNPSEELYRDELKAWAKKVKVIRLVDHIENMPWDGDREGLVTAPIAGLKLDPVKTFAVLCGPPVMYKFVVIELDQKKIPHEQIYIDLERRMKCGVGKCGHCQINSKYCCTDGPVFRLADSKDLPEALA